MLNLRHIFQRTGQLFITELRQNVERQTDIDGQRYRPIKPSTAKARQGAKGFGRGLGIRLQTGATKARDRLTKGGKLISNLSVPITRLLFTGQFKQHAFQYEASNKDVRVFVNKGFYHSEESTGGRGLVTYRDIVAYNQKGSPEVNPHIASPPSVFPLKSQDVMMMKAMDGFKRLVRSEIPNIQKQIVGGGIKLRNQILL